MCVCEYIMYIRYIHIYYIYEVLQNGKVGLWVKDEFIFVQQILKHMQAFCIIGIFHTDVVLQYMLIFVLWRTVSAKIAFSWWSQSIKIVYIKHFVIRLKIRFYIGDIIVSFN